MKVLQEINGLGSRFRWALILWILPVDVLALIIGISVAYMSDWCSVLETTAPVG
jgi:hypothetical protein